MAIFETPKKENTNSYVALLDSEGELVAFISPVKGVAPELIASAMTEKGLKVEVRTPKEDRLEIKL